MKALASTLRFVPAMLLAIGFFTGCESTDGGGSGSSASVYYGVGIYDPWYYGGSYHDDVDIVVTPPPVGERPIAPPGPERPQPPPRPEHPIATPPSAPAPAPRPTPMPSIPSMPRASFRR